MEDSNIEKQQEQNDEFNTTATAKILKIHPVTVLSEGCGWGNPRPADWESLAFQSAAAARVAAGRLALSFPATSSWNGRSSSTICCRSPWWC